MTATLAVNRIHWPVQVLGPGRRIGIWVQGCSIGCPGCASRDTWPAVEAEGRPSIDEILDRFTALVDGPVDGITVSGGEPLDQPAGIERFLVAARSWLEDRGDTDGDILLYTGYTEAAGRLRSRAAFDLADAVVTGPYVAGTPGGAWWGSGNQRLVVTTPRFAPRYRDALDGARPRVQVAVSADAVHVVGIPSAGTLETVEGRLAAAGIHLEDVSWRP